MKPGGRLESLILKTAEYLARNQIARIWKWPVETREVRKTKVCRCGRPIFSKEIMYAKRTGFDFFGYTTAGRVIAIEAKEFDGNRLPWDSASHGVKSHQVDALREVYRIGGYACVLWMRGEEVRMVGPLRARVSRPSVHWDEDADFVLMANGRLALDDWLKSTPTYLR